MSLIDREKTMEEIPIDVCDGFEVTDIIEKMPTVKAIPLDKVKQERERQYSKSTQALYNEKYLYAVKILDKLIEESEG